MVRKISSGDHRLFGLIPLADEKQGSKIIGLALVSSVIIAIGLIFFPDVYPFGLFEFVTWKGTFLEVLYNARWVFAWGVGVTTLVSFLTWNHWMENHQAEEGLKRDFWVAVNAGVLEEIIFRWLIFYGAIATVTFMNFLFFGFLGFGVFEFTFWVVGSVADFTTGGFMGYLFSDWAKDGPLTPYLFGEWGWAVGAALLTANGHFRNGHAYMGLFGLVNSWFIGMFLFWLMFVNGLLAAIFVHFLYDLLIFVVRYVDKCVERVLDRRMRQSRDY